MDNRAIALRLVLDHLGTNQITTVDQRMEVQKAVYLAQSLGVHLGYSYGWYVKGPYSPSLTRDYYDLAEDIPAEKKLQEAAVQKLDQIKNLMVEDVDGLARPQKLELLASLHYLIKRSGMTEAAAKKQLASLKPHLAANANRGIELLRNEGLL